MKTKNFKFKSMALVLFALVLSSNVWGADVTFDLTKITQITTQTASSVVFTSGVATLSISQGSGGTAVNNYMPGGSTSATHTRTYQKNPITFNAGSGKKLASVTIQVTSSSGAIAQITNGTWSAEVTTSGSSPTITYTLKTAAQSITVTPAGTSRIEKVEYTYVASKTLSSIAVTTQPTKKSYTTCETLDLSGCVVTATYSDGSTENVTSSCTFNPANGAALTTSVTSVAVSYEGKAATISDISVTEGASDTYVDNVHGLTPSGDFSCSYKAPSLKDRTKGEMSSCEDTHYHFVGWVEDGVDPQTNPVISAGTDMTGSNKTYKAVWAAEENE